MDKSVLVSVDLRQGSQVLNILESAGIRVKVAVFVHFTEYEGWRLVLSGRQFDAMDLGEAYGSVHQALRAAGIDSDSEPIFMIFAMNDPFIKDLRRRFGKARKIEGIRLGSDTIGDRWVEEGYVYRIA